MAAARPRNALLQSLSTDDWAQLKDGLDPAELAKGDILYEMDDPARWVFFPETGLISVITILVSGEAVETSVVGREGCVGFIEALGSGTMNSRFLVQIPGLAYRFSARAFLEAFRSSSPLQRAAHQQIELLQSEARLSIACRTTHPVEARFNRWLLECCDLAGCGYNLPLNQELLAVMLGVQRTTVTKVATIRQRERVIRYRRGHIEVLDSAQLEKGACACRATLQDLRRSLAPKMFADRKSLHLA